MKENNKKNCPVCGCFMKYVDGILTETINPSLEETYVEFECSWCGHIE